MEAQEELPPSWVALLRHGRAGSWIQLPLLPNLGFFRNTVLPGLGGQDSWRPNCNKGAGAMAKYVTTEGSALTFCRVIWGRVIDSNWEVTRVWSCFLIASPKQKQIKKWSTVHFYPCEIRLFTVPAVPPGCHCVSASGPLCFPFSLHRTRPSPPFFTWWTTSVPCTRSLSTPSLATPPWPLLTSSSGRAHPSLCCAMALHPGLTMFSSYLSACHWSVTPWGQGHDLPTLETTELGVALGRCLSERVGLISQQRECKDGPCFMFHCIIFRVKWGEVIQMMPVSLWSLSFEGSVRRCAESPEAVQTQVPAPSPSPQGWPSPFALSESV